MILIALLSLLLLLTPTVMPAQHSEAASFQVKKPRKVQTVTYEVSMHCQKCVDKLTDKLSFLKGVEDLKISLDSKTVTITYNPAKTDEVTLQKAIEKCGYSARKVEGN